MKKKRLLLVGLLFLFFCIILLYDMVSNDKYRKERLLTFLQLETPYKELESLPTNEDFDSTQDDTPTMLSKEPTITPVLSHPMDSTMESDTIKQSEYTSIDSFLVKDDLRLLSANTVIDISKVREIKNSAFFYQSITEDIREKIYGVSYKKDAKISLDELSYVRVLHYDFHGEVRIGELIVNKSIATDIVDIFFELYESQYPIERMVLVDEYNGDDTLSMEDNNTSAFNYRSMVGSPNLSKHSLGLAIDVNPLYNPYVKETDGILTILPPSSKNYVDRTNQSPYYIAKADICYEAFVSRGYTWGGDWNSLKDYQHFEK